MSDPWPPSPERLNGNRAPGPDVWRAHRCTLERAAVCGRDLDRDAWMILAQVLGAVTSWTLLYRDDLTHDALARQVWPNAAHRARPHGYYLAKVRRALRSLDELGLVVYDPGRGARPTRIGLIPCGEWCHPPSADPSARFGARDHPRASERATGRALQAARPYTEDSNNKEPKRAEPEPVDNLGGGAVRREMWNNYAAGSARFDAKRSERPGDGR